MFNHPEVSKYGLELDFDTWVEFNKELVIRDIMRKELPSNLDLYIKDNNKDVIRLYNIFHKDISNEIEALRRKKYLTYNYEVIK